MSGENKKMPHGLEITNVISLKSTFNTDFALAKSNPCGNISFYKTRCACPSGNIKRFLSAISVKSLLSILIMLALLSFLSLATAHIEHDCTGEDCAVCLTLEIARISLRSMAVATAAFAISLRFTFTKQAVPAKSELEKVKTLVTEKIKLSD